MEAAGTSTSRSSFFYFVVRWKRPLPNTKSSARATGRMSGDEHPSLTKSHWRDVAPPLFTKEELGSSSGTATPLDMATLLALFAFVGVVVRCPRAPGR